jgi:hydrogenase-4 component B
MTYTATGFSNPVRVVFRAIFRPRAQDVNETVANYFRTAIRRSYEEVDIVSRLFIEPVTRTARGLSTLVARLHNGRINSYVVYVLATLAVFVLIAWLVM